MSRVFSLQGWLGKHTMESSWLRWIVGLQFALKAICICTLHTPNSEKGVPYKLLSTFYDTIGTIGKGKIISRTVSIVQLRFRLAGYVIFRSIYFTLWHPIKLQTSSTGTSTGRRTSHWTRQWLIGSRLRLVRSL